MAGHWVVIETGSNQAFVFASNKQAVNVGASELIRRVGMRWVPDAVAQLGGSESAQVEQVVVASGKALLIVGSVSSGRSIIRTVTERALREAPGLQVWGVVDPEPIANGADLAPALERAHRLHATRRALRPSSLMRAPTLPYVKPCQYSGLPATAIGREGTGWYPRGAAVHAAWRLAGAGRSRMAELLTDRAVLSADKLDRGVNEAGWIAVVHADGNGVGELFRNLHRAFPGSDYTSRVGGFSAALDDVARQALRDAVGNQPEREDWILPIVIGGDDLTAIMDGQVAFDVTVEFLRRFEHRSAAHPVIQEVVAAVLSRIAPSQPHPEGLTACAGIAFVKPHHPFSDAYPLAEQLCRAAKAVKDVDRRYSALDFHVLHDSVGRSLAQLRDSSVVRADEEDSTLRLWSGPIVVTGDGEESPFLEAHHVTHLREAMDGQQKLGTGAVHQLREALLSGGAGIERAVTQVRAWAEDPGTADAYLNAHLRVPEPAVSAESGGSETLSFSRVLDALNLLDMSHGTVEGGRRQHAEAIR